jgi:hypothetical protein
MAPRIQYMKVSDQFRDLAVLFPGKEHLSTVWWCSSGSDSRDGRFGEQKRLLAVSGTEGQSLGLPGYSLDTIWTAVSRLPFDYACLIVEFTKVMKFSYRRTYLVVERHTNYWNSNKRMHTILSKSQYYSTPAPTYFGPHCPIIRERTIVHNRCFIRSVCISRKLLPMKYLYRRSICAQKTIKFNTRNYNNYLTQEITRII